MKDNTLRLTCPLGETVFLALGVLVVLLGALEVLARTDFACLHLPPPSIGSPYAMLEVKLNRLDALVEQGVQIDCLIVGSSMVNRGFDTEAFRRGFEAQTGETMQCFNFGIGQLTASEAGVLAGILVDRYDPQLLIYGVSLRDFDDSLGNANVVVDIPWTQYQLGNQSLAGWLSNHSRSYGYFLTFTSWYKPDLWASRQRREEQVLTYGYMRGKKSGGRPKVSKRDRKWLSNYEMSESDWVGLQQIIWLADGNVRVVLVEMPLARTIVEAFPDGAQDYDELFIKELDELATATNTPFWQTNSQGLVPDDHWGDAYHLTRDGAAIFGEWLGHQVGKLE